MAERTRRYAKRPLAFALTFAFVGVMGALAVAGLARLAGAPL